MKPLQVCFLIPGFSDGGAQKQCIQLLHALKLRGEVDLHLIYFHGGVHEPALKADGLSIHRVSGRSNYDPRNIWEAFRILRQIRPDILLTWLHACDVYGYVLKRLLPRTVWLMTERDSSYPKEVRYWIRNQVGRRADGIVANSRKGLEYWERLGARGRRFTVPNIVDHLGFRRYETAKKPNLILYAGRLELQKNPITLIHAFCTLARRRPDLRFRVVGEGSLRKQMESIVEAQQLGAWVEFLGFRHDVVDLIAESRVVVSLSHHEGTPNVILESVAVGTSVVVSDIPEHRDVLGDAYPYMVSMRSDPEACAACIEAALADTRPELGLEPAASALAEMSPQRVGAAYIAIFQEMAGEHARQDR